MPNSQIAGPLFACAALSAAEERHLNSRLLQQMDAEAVTHIKSLEHFTGFGGP